MSVLDSGVACSASSPLAASPSALYAAIIPKMTTTLKNFTDMQCVEAIEDIVRYARETEREREREEKRRLAGGFDDRDDDRGNDNDDDDEENNSRNGRSGHRNGNGNGNGNGRPPLFLSDRFFTSTMLYLDSLKSRVLKNLSNPNFPTNTKSGFCKGVKDCCIDACLWGGRRFMENPDELLPDLTSRKSIEDDHMPRADDLPRCPIPYIFCVLNALDLRHLHLRMTSRKIWKDSNNHAFTATRWRVFKLPGLCGDAKLGEEHRIRKGILDELKVRRQLRNGSRRCPRPNALFLFNHHNFFPFFSSSSSAGVLPLPPPRPGCRDDR